MCRRLNSQRPGSVLKYFIDAMDASWRHGASPENYFVLRFYELSQSERAKYLTSGRSKAADKILNAQADPKERACLGYKPAFLAAFPELCGRRYIEGKAAEPDQIAEFLASHESIIIKPCKGTMGKGVEKLDTKDLDREEFCRRCREEELLLEELIIQHPALAALNPSSVNTIRVNSARGKDGRLRTVGACLKVGAAGSGADNFHSGGLAFPVDIESGKICGPGRDNSSIKDHPLHPGTGESITGFQIPHWGECMALVTRAMDALPSLGYVGWDIAVREDRPVLVEGNISWPGGNIIQFDGKGKYPIIMDCVGEA